MTAAPIQLAAITADEVRASVVTAQTHLEKAAEQVVWQLRNRTWTVLGYADWEEMRDAEYGGAAIIVPRADRPELVARLRSEGLSQRETAATLGVSLGTVNGDVFRNEHGHPKPLPTKPAEHECTECGQHFKSEHWHCAGCDGHYPVGTVTTCPTCNPHAMVLDPDTGEVTDPPAPTTSRRSPPPPAPPLRTPEQENAEQASAELGRAILALTGAGLPEWRDATIRAWTRGAIGATPMQRDRVNPASFRAIATGLVALADEWEQP